MEDFLQLVIFEDITINIKTLEMKLNKASSPIGLHCEICTNNSIMYVYTSKGQMLSNYHWR